jgi:protease IV
MERWHRWSMRVMLRWWAAGWLISPLILAGCITLNIPGGKPGKLIETVVEGKRGPKIALVAIEGVLREGSGTRAFGLIDDESPVARLRAQLQKAAMDDAVKAVVLRIHSPGGTATASEILYSEIQHFKARKQVPVVAELMGTATSGAYYAAMAADIVLAHPTTVTGSIGVIFAGVNLTGLMDKLGIENQTITTGPFKDAGSPLRRMTPDERLQVQGVLDDLYKRFLEVVVAGRPNLSPERVATLADGRIYSAMQAWTHGLVDGIADLPGAIAETKRRAGLEEARVVSYHRRREWRENIYTYPSAPTVPLLDLEALLGPVQRPAFLYLWWPGLD